MFPEAIREYVVLGPLYERGYDTRATIGVFRNKSADAFKEGGTAIVIGCPCMNAERDHLSWRRVGVEHRSENEKRIASSNLPAPERSLSLNAHHGEIYSQKSAELFCGGSLQSCSPLPVVNEQSTNGVPVLLEIVSACSRIKAAAEQHDRFCMRSHKFNGSVYQGKAFRETSFYFLAYLELPM
jgi:hypothetical protein